MIPGKAVTINESAPQWVKDIWPDATIAPDSEVMALKPATEAPIEPKPTTSTSVEPKHWESGGINPHARPDGGEYGRD